MLRHAMILLRFSPPIYAAAMIPAFVFTMLLLVAASCLPALYTLRRDCLITFTPRRRQRFDAYAAADVATRIQKNVAWLRMLRCHAASAMISPTLSAPLFSPLSR